MLRRFFFNNPKHLKNYKNVTVLLNFRENINKNTFIEVWFCVYKLIKNEEVLARTYGGLVLGSSYFFYTAPAAS